MALYAEIALPVPLFKLYTYVSPIELEDKLKPGLRVKVPFNGRNLKGIIFNLHSTPPETEKKDIKYLEITGICDSFPVLNDELMKLIVFLETNYGVAPGEAARLISPSFTFTERKENPHVELNPDYIKIIKKITKNLALVIQYMENRTIAQMSEIVEDLGLTRKHINDYIEKKILFKKQFVLKEKIQKGESILKHELTELQKTSVNRLKTFLNEKKFREFLLYGVTGSGKTEVYLNIIEEVILNGGSIIYLVPEISLIPQTVLQLQNLSKEEVSTWHSKMKTSDKKEEYLKILKGDCKIVVGTRSAIFSPIKNLQLIIIDEEHDGSYVQSDDVNYDARKIAEERAKINNAIVIYGSATPSIKTYHRGIKNKIEILSLPERIDNRAMPEIRTIHLLNDSASNRSISKKLEEEMRLNLESGGQTLLFLNRKGYAPVILCRKCGKAVKCKHCDVSLTFHRSNGDSICHMCGYRLKKINKCNHCDCTSFKYVGFGTERIVEEARRLFPGATVKRFDADTIRNEEDLRNTIKLIKEGGVDILAGTQIFSKGHDFKGLTLVGVISADTSMSLPDFRASERTFQMITQVTGRAGRDESAGKALIQSYSSSHYAIRCAIENDFESFYKKEINFRKKFSYPPYSRIIRFLITGIEESMVKTAIEELHNMLVEIKDDNWNIKKPVEAPVYRIRQRYRRHILIFIDNTGIIPLSLKVVRETCLRKKWMRKLNLKMEIDPEDIL